MSNSVQVDVQAVTAGQCVSLQHGRLICVIPPKSMRGDNMAGVAGGIHLLI